MTYIEFANKIKSKYPEYRDIDNLELAKKIVNKYPEYTNIVTFDEAPAEAPKQPKLVGKYNPLRLLPGVEYRPPAQTATPPSAPSAPQPGTTVNKPEALKVPMFDLTNLPKNVVFPGEAPQAPAPRIPQIKPEDFSKEKSIFNKKEKKYVVDYPFFAGLVQGADDIKTFAKTGREFANATLATLNPLLSWEQKKYFWEKVPQAEEKNPEAVDRVSNSVALISLAYGGIEVMKRIPEFAKWLSSQSGDLIRRITIRERGLAVLTDEELLNIYKTAPQEYKATMARNNPRLQNILKGLNIIPEESVIAAKAPAMAKAPIVAKTPAKPAPTTTTKPAEAPITPKPAEIMPAIEEASKHGKVVGIDASTKLPVIDTTQKPAIQAPEVAKAPEKNITETFTIKLENIKKELDKHTEDVMNTGKVKSIDLIGSLATKREGHDTDILYDLGMIKLPKDSNKAVEYIENYTEKNNIPIGDTPYDTFIKADDRYFHLQKGAGQILIENNEYAKSQIGKKMIRLSTKPATMPVETPTTPKIEAKPAPVVETPAKTEITPKTPESALMEEAKKYKNELKNMGAEIKGNNVKLYRGGNVDIETLKKLRYGDYLSIVKTGTDAQGNAGASSYGKNIIEIYVPIEDIKITNGEIQYKGKSSSLLGGEKYPKEIYQAYNDVYGSNYTAKEIDKMDNVKTVASQGLSGGREEYDQLLDIYNKAHAKPTLTEESEIKKVSNNLLKNNTDISKKDAEAMARDIIKNRKYNKSISQPTEPMPVEIPAGKTPQRVEMSNILQRGKIQDTGYIFETGKGLWQFKGANGTYAIDLSKGGKDAHRLNKYKGKLNFYIPATNMEPGNIIFIRKGMKGIQYNNRFVKVIDTNSVVDLTKEEALAELKQKGVRLPKDIVSKIEAQPKRPEMPGVEREVVGGDDLYEGDEFTINGEKYRVISRTDNKVMLKDGKTIGMKTSETLRIDKGTLKPPSFEPAEYIVEPVEKPVVKETTKIETPKADIKGAYDRYFKIAKDNGLNSKQAHDYALESMKSEKPAEIPQVKPKQAELGVPGGVEEFGKGKKGEAELPLTKKPKEETKKGLQDFGEKIGGARKDIAERGLVKTTVKKPEIEGPIWKSKYEARGSDTAGWHVVPKDAPRYMSFERGSKFTTKEEAEKAIPLYAVAKNHRVFEQEKGKFEIYKIITNRKLFKVVNKTFASREEGMKYMSEHAEDILNTKTTFGEEILPVPEIATRIGKPRRTADATPEMFMETFKPRGIEFGNWNNQEERQMVLNHAYDGLMDLADILGVNPNALTLNGELAIAFGARGQGLTGARAHYEPEYGVINLTKMKGAGALAHEWFHALDHYFGRLDTKAATEKIKNLRGDMIYPRQSEEKTFLSHGASYKSKARPEVIAAYEKLMKTMYFKAEKYVQDTKKADDFLAKSRDYLKEQLDKVRNNLTRDFTKETYWKDKKIQKWLKPASAEQLAEFDKLSSSILEGGNLDLKLITTGEKLTTSNIHLSNDTLEAINKIIKDVRNRGGFNSQKFGLLDSVVPAMRTYAGRLQLFEQAKNKTVLEKMVPTDYNIEAKKMDNTRYSDYWSVPHEMASRAFASYVEDKIAKMGGQSDFLVYQAHGGILLPMIDGFIARPYPEGAERVMLEKAFDDFMDVIKKIKKDEQGIPITPIKQPSEITEFGAGTTPPKEVRKYLDDIIHADKSNIDKLKKTVKYYLGTKEERWEVILGKERGRQVFEQLRRFDREITLLKSNIERRNKDIFKGIPVPIREHIFRVLKGIDSMDSRGIIKFGALQPSGIIKDKTAGTGQLLTDGRVVGDEIFPGEFITYRKFDTAKDYETLIKKYPLAEKVIKKYIENNEEILKTKLGSEIPAFSRNVMKMQYDIKTKQPAGYSYVPSMPKEERFFGKIKNLFKTYTASSRKFKTGALSESGREEEDLLKALTTKQNEIAYERLFNDTAGNILASVLEPIEGKLKDGHVSVNLNSPKIKGIVELKKDLLLANGINPEEISKYQYPAAVEREFKFQEVSKVPTVVKETAKAIGTMWDKTMGMILSNYLLRPSSAVRNFVSGGIQYNLKTLTHMYEGLMGKGFDPMIQDIKAPIRALAPSLWKELPSEVLGQQFYSDLTGAFKPLDIGLIPFKSVEVFWKRASFDADLNIAANKRYEELLKNGAIKPNQRTQYIQQFRQNYFQDMFQFLSDNANSVTFDYWDKPYAIEKLQNGIGRGLIPYPNYLYHKIRMYAEYSPLGLTNITPENKINKIAKALAGMTSLVTAFAIAKKFADKRKDDLKELEMKQLPYELDTTGRIRVHTDGKVERWLRVYDQPYIGDALYFLEIMNGQAEIGSWVHDILSTGPIFNAAAMLSGFKSKYTQNKPPASIAGQEIAGYIPFGAYLNYLRVLADPVKRQTYAKDNSALENFINPIVNVIPGASRTLPEQVGKTGKEKGQVRKYDISSETMKLFILNVKSIDKKEYLDYMNDQIASGKSEKRRIKKAREEYRAQLMRGRR